MSSALLLLLLAACSRLPGCAEPAPELTPIVAPVPQADAWPHPWRWAAVVQVRADLAAPVELSGGGEVAGEAAAAEAAAGEAAAGEAAAPVGQPGTTPIHAPPAGEAPGSGAAPGAEARPAVALGPSIVRDAFVDSAVSVWQAAPGAALVVPGGAPEIAGLPQAWTVPPDALDGSWLVATDLGVHRVEWTGGDAVTEIRVALGIQPWRAIVAVGLGRELGAAREAEVVQARLREHGVVVLSADGTDPVSVPWEDAPLSEVDVPGLLAGAPTGFVLAAEGQAPKVVLADQPVRLLREASTYFGVDLLPAPPSGKGREGKGGKAGKAGKAGRPVGKLGKGKRGAPREEQETSP